MSCKKVLGVQVIPLEHVLKQYENAKCGYLYYRKLLCKRTSEFTYKMEKLIKKTDTTCYDLDPIDWVKAKFDIELGDEQKDNKFWCSALVSYIYVKLGLLPETLLWTIVSPKQCSFYDVERLCFSDCMMNPEQFITY